MKDTTTDPLPKKTGFAIPLLPSNSINDTLEFYKAFGSIVTYQQKAPNNYLGLKVKDIEIHFFGMKIKPEANFSTCYLVVDDIDTFYNSCREGLKKKYGKIPLKGIPRINPIKDMPTYGVRQFILIDPSGNYIRIGQPIEKTASVMFEENGKKPQKGTPLSKAYELASRLADGKDDLEAAIKVIDKALLVENSVEKEMLFKLILLGIDIAHRNEQQQKAKELLKKGKLLLKSLKGIPSIKKDIDLFNQLLEELE
jgi:hypothetical protein